MSVHFSSPSQPLPHRGPFRLLPSLCLGALWLTAAAHASHVGRFGAAYTGPSDCLRCHAGKVDEVMASVHYTWRTPNPNLAYPGGGSHGMLDRFCGLVGSSAMVNYYADMGAFTNAAACGKCHVGRSLPFPDPATGQFTQAQKDGIDCLICHASEGNYDMNGDGVYDEEDAEATHRVLLTDPDTGRSSWCQDRSLRAAESVGGPVGTAACLRCHEHGMAAPDYKRGTPYDREHDVHATAYMLCTDCHEVARHQMARGSMVTDMHAWERQDVEVSCVKCHTSQPHPVWPDNPAFVPYNEHAAFIACETCHIPWTSGASRRIWTSTYGVTNGFEASVPQLDSATGTYEPVSQYTSAYNTRPVYRWFNGSVSMLAEPMNESSAWDFRIASKATPGAKIYPFRPVVNGMVMDRGGYGQDPNFNPQFTMAAALEAMQGPMKMMGFMRPEGLTERERAVLSQFPNLLPFDETEYFHSGNVREAVNIGLGRLAMLMNGQDAFAMPASALSAAGSTLWSGDLIGMDMPNNPADPNYDPGGGPTVATGSFISLSHAVRRDGAFKCLDCHSQNSVLDYHALGYTSQQADHLKTLLEKVQIVALTPSTNGVRLRWTTIPGQTYQVQCTSDLGSGAWAPVSTPTRTIARWLECVVPNSALTNAGPKFFRVWQVPP